MHALNDLLQEGGFDIEPIARVETQAAYEDGLRARKQYSGVKIPVLPPAT